jgi:hypothetical protein
MRSKIVAFLLFSFTTLSAHAAMDITEAVAQSTRNVTVTDVTLAPIPHDDAMMLMIHTNAGQRNIIVAKSAVNVAIAALMNPHISGYHNAMVTSRIIQNPIVPRQIPAPAAPLAKAIPASELPHFVPQLASASATIAVAATAANQQASK